MLAFVGVRQGNRHRDRRDDGHAEEEEQKNDVEEEDSDCDTIRASLHTSSGDISIKRQGSSNAIDIPASTSLLSSPPPLQEVEELEDDYGRSLLSTSLPNKSLLALQNDADASNSTAIVITTNANANNTTTIHNNKNNTFRSPGAYPRKAANQDYGSLGSKEEMSPVSKALFSTPFRFAPTRYPSTPITRVPTHTHMNTARSNRTTRSSRSTLTNASDCSTQWDLRYVCSRIVPAAAAMVVVGVPHSYIRNP